MPRKRPKKSATNFKGAENDDFLPRRELSELTDRDALALYQRYQVLWLRLPEKEQGKCTKFGIKALKSLDKQCPSLFSSHWCVENPGEYSKESLTAANVFTAPKPPNGAFYVSSILQKQRDNIAKFFREVPFAEPDLLAKAKAKHDDGVWLFLGSNPEQAVTKGKRRRPHEGDGSALCGRPEHTDAVDHSGTWHVQLQGSKTWYIFPAEEAEDWRAAGAPTLRAGQPGVVGRGKGGLRLKVECEAGDLLLINTRAWWHRTEIPTQAQGVLSVSYARDFYLHGAKRNKPAPQKTEEDGEGEEEGGEEEEEEKTNDETLDPRMFAQRSFRPHEVVMTEDQFPDADLPRSTHPNCSLAEMEDDSVALVALQRIKAGDALTVGVGADSDSDDYEEWELDPETGEMFRVEG